MDDPQNEILYRKIVERKPALKRLSFYVPGSTSDVGRDADGNVSKALNLLLEQLLQVCYQSLETLIVRGTYPIASLSLPPFVKLKTV